MIDVNELQINDLIDTYMNNMQVKASLIDTNVLIGEWGRATGKTTFMASRMKRVVDSMPGELSFLVHKSYVSLMSNVVPALRAEFTKPVGKKQEPWMVEGIDFVVGTADIPKHFKAPRYPVSYPKHSIIFSNGANLQLVASDQPDSVAGRSGVHAFIEEMKHNKGEKVKSRLFPALRGSESQKIRSSPYYQGITGISDTARVDLGEDNWFEEYEKNMNTEVIEDVFSVAKHVNDNMLELLDAELRFKKEKDLFKRDKLRSTIKSKKHIIKVWDPILRDLKRNSTYYLRGSSFANKDFLGEKFFKTQMDTLSIEEFLVSICALRRRQVRNMFFAGFNKTQHCFTDSYIYDSIMKFNLKDTFKLDASYLKHFDPQRPLDIGYDPGNFQSFVVGQEKTCQNEYRILKEFYCWEPKDQGDLAREFFDFFGSIFKNRKINLYYDRAGNKKKHEEDKITTDARILKRELEAYGFKVKLMNEKQRTIFLYEHYKLISIILAENLRSVVRLKICENQCPNLISSIFVSPLLKTDGKIDLDKSSEVKLDWRYQAGLSTQIPSALMYLIFGKFHKILPGVIKKTPLLLENTIG